MHPTSSCNLRHCSIEAVIFASAIEAWGFGLEHELGMSKHLVSRVKCSCRLHIGKLHTAFYNQYKTLRLSCRLELRLSTARPKRPCSLKSASDLGHHGMWHGFLPSQLRVFALKHAAGTWWNKSWLNSAEQGTAMVPHKCIQSLGEESCTWTP